MSQFPLSSLCQHTAAPCFFPSLLSKYALIIFACFRDTHVKYFLCDLAEACLISPFVFVCSCIVWRLVSFKENTQDIPACVSAELSFHSLLQNETIAPLALLHCRVVPVYKGSVKLCDYALQSSNIGIVIIIIAQSVLRQVHRRLQIEFSRWCVMVPTL